MDWNNLEYKIRVTKSIGSKTGTVSLIFFYSELLNKNGKSKFEIPVFLITEKFIYATKNCKIFWLNGQPKIFEVIFIFFNDQKLDEFLVELKKKWQLKGQENDL